MDTNTNINIYTNNNCIICLESENNENNILQELSYYRNDVSECNCKYNIHQNCYEGYCKKYGAKCMLCKKELVSYSIEENHYCSIVVPITELDTQPYSQHHYPNIIDITLSNNQNQNHNQNQTQYQERNQLYRHQLQEIRNGQRYRIEIIARIFCVIILLFVVYIIIDNIIKI